MFLTSLLHWFKGYLVITVEGQYPERFFNVCAKRNILIRDLQVLGDGKLRCLISNRGFCLLPDIARKTGVTVKIEKKHGLPLILGKLNRRKGFLVGVAGFLLLFVGMNQFIWKIDIVGCESVSPKVVSQVLAECGLKVGTFRPFLDEKALQNQVLIRLPELSWIWADKSGSKVLVQVKEKVPKPEMFDPDAYCNLIARKDGVITDIIVRSGVPMVAVGDSVVKGDILVSGLLVNEKGLPPRMVQSDGELMARSWYEKSREFPLWQEKRLGTGAKETKVTLHLFGWDLRLFWKEEPSFAAYSQESRNEELNLFGYYLGVGLSRQVFWEEEIFREKLTAESVVDGAVQTLLQEIDAETAPNSKLIHSEFSYELIDDDRILVNLTTEYLEDIAQKMKL